MFWFNHHHRGAYYLSFAKVIVIEIISYNTSSWLDRWCGCIVTDYFSNYNFSKAQIILSPMMVIKPKHVGALGSCDPASLM